MRTVCQHDSHVCALPKRIAHTQTHIHTFSNALDKHSASIQSIGCFAFRHTRNKCITDKRNEERIKLIPCPSIGTNCVFHEQNKKKTIERERES